MHIICIYIYMYMYTYHVCIHTDRPKGGNHKNQDWTPIPIWEGGGLMALEDICISIDASMHIIICICIYIYIYIYTHTYVYICMHVPACIYL